MAFKLNQNKKNKDENKTTTNCVKEDKQVQEQSEKRKSKTARRNRRKTYSVCLPSGSNTNNSRSQSVPLPLLPTPLISTMATYYPQNYSQSIRVPLVAAYPVYTYQPLPVVVNPIVAHVCPFTCAVVPQIITPVVQPVVTEIPAVHYNYEQEASVSYVNSVTEPTEDIVQYYEVQDENNIHYIEEITYEEDTAAEATEENNENPEDSEVSCDVTTCDLTDSSSDPIEIYLSLPRELFPPSRMLLIDPNPMIDEFCKLENVNKHVPWLLDLEYGVPKFPVTRQIPIYNVYYNSIHCKNTPDAIHPGFNSCSDEFKQVMLFYYDSIISSLYMGYVIFNRETSVEKFESWLLLPMQVLGMCWP